MKARISQFYNIHSERHEKWCLEIKSRNDRRYKIVNRVFDTAKEAQDYFDKYCLPKK